MLIHDIQQVALWCANCENYEDSECRDRIEGNCEIIVYRNKIRETISIYLTPAAASSDSDASSQAYHGRCQHA